MSLSFSRRVPGRVSLRSFAAFVGAMSLVLALSPAPAGAAEDPATAATRATPSNYDAALLVLLEAVRNGVTATPPNARRECRYAGGDSRDVPTQITKIFRCHLREVGVSDRRARQMAAEAVVVAHCESLFDPAAVVFDGRYRDTPHPNGNRYSAAGVFQFIRKTADRWINGGYSNVHDIRLNIDAAARLFIHNRSRGYRGWEDWACAAANDGFKVGSVLPGWAGGPVHLPAWAYFEE